MRSPTVPPIAMPVLPITTVEPTPPSAGSSGLPWPAIAIAGIAFAVAWLLRRSRAERRDYVGAFNRLLEEEGP